MASFFKSFSRVLQAPYKTRLIGGTAASLSLMYAIQNSAEQSTCKETQSLQNHFDFGAQMLPHQTEGEDAYFAESNLIAVADGFGSWAQKGYNPQEHSRTLIKNIEQNYKSNVLKYLSNPKLLLIHSAKAMNVMGSSTIVVVAIDKERKVLKATQVGHCGFCIYRLDEKGSPKLIYNSQEHQKSFNFPYQIGNSNCGDSANTALEYEHPIENKDIVIVGSDGLFDNLDFQQIRNTIPANIIKQKDIDVQSLAQDIARIAKSHSLQWFYDSPFAKKLRNYNQTHQPYMGGKMDDITVVVAQINVN